MNQPTIVVPSHRRAGKVKTPLAVADTIICIPQAQYAEYRQHHSARELVCHPDDVLGIWAKRQWIYDWFGDVAMLDDDVQGIARQWRPKGATIPTKMKPEEARDAIYATAATAEELGAFLYGFSPNQNPRWYTMHRPLRFGPFARTLIGMRAGSNLFFPDVPLISEDDWLCLLNAYHHRFLLVDTRYSVVCTGTGTAPGGTEDFRKLEVELETNKFIVDAFGDAVVVAWENGKPFRKCRPPWKM